ncbi:MAG: TIGR03663 family protein [Dehalococcoidia bacterium]|nr:TIGR03663 family protein [Dehalococcoidia bacterium]
MTVPAISARHSISDTVGRLLALRIPLTVEVGVYAVIFALAFGFRFWDLGANALHHDESIHAQWSWDLARGQYTHNPIFHGPLYYHVQAFVFWVLGASDYTARASAAIFGMVLVGLPLLLRRHLGALGSIAAVAFIAFSPTIVYYSRFMREDIYMAVFILLMAAAMWRYMDTGRDRWLVVFALALAGAFATKEATFLMVAIFLLFTNACIAADLARATLTDRARYTTGRMLDAHRGSSLCVGDCGTVALPGPLRASAAWQHMPRAGDVLIILGR